MDEAAREAVIKTTNVRIGDVTFLSGFFSLKKRSSHARP
jgi:hypothetical protein